MKSETNIFPMGSGSGLPVATQPPSHTTIIQCPECGSKKTWKDGIRYTVYGEIQRHICRDCSYRFSHSDPSETSERLQKLQSLILKTKPDEAILCRVGATQTTGAKNLVEVETRTQEKAAGATLDANVNSTIVQFLWWMKKQGYKETTILSRDSRLKRLVRLGGNLSDPESIKEVIASQGNWSESRKEAMVYTFDLFAKWSGQKWEKPTYKPPRKLPFIPLEREIDDLAAGCNKYVATFLQVAKETGARAGEIFGLQWTDIDLENRTIRITAEKGSNPRILKISTRLLGMLAGFRKEDLPIFSHYKSLQSLRRCFDRYRKRTAHKYGNPRILEINLHTLRHWKATTEYHKTKDILHVMQLLGHRSINNTLVYTQLMKTQENDEFICKVARMPNEVQELIENGFEYITELDHIKFFRKRK